MKTISGFSTDQMWDAIERLASISTSVTSNGQRQVHDAYEASKGIGSGTFSSSPSTPPPSIEQATGTLLDDES